MTPKKRQDRFFGSGADRDSESGGPNPKSGEAGSPGAAPSSFDEFAIVDSEGRPPRSGEGHSAPASGSSSAGASKAAAQGQTSGGRKSSPSSQGAEEVAPYIPAPSRKRRSSLGWAWLTIVVTLILAVGSYWFYEGFDGDIEKVRERFEAFSNRLVPEDRMKPVSTPEEGRDSAMASGLDPSAPLPVVTGAETKRENLERPDSVTGQRVEPSNDPEMVDRGRTIERPSGVALDGTRLGGETVASAESAAPDGPQLPTRRGPVAPTRREPPPAETSTDDDGWYRTDPSLSLENASPEVLAANAPDATPRPLIRATPEPEMTPFASGVLGPDDRYTDSPRPTQTSGRPTAPAVALPTELSTYQETPTPTPSPTPTPTPTPAPVRPSDAGMAQMSVGRVTAGAQLVDLGLVYASRALTGIHKNFSPPFRKEGAITRVSFLIRKNGEIYGVAVEKSSGSDGLDSSAVRAVSKTSPLEPLPPEIKGDATRVEVQFEF